MRSHLLEGHGPPSACPPVRLHPRARRLLRRAGPRRARRGHRGRPARQPQPAERRCTFRDDDHLDPPADDLRAAVARAPPRRGRRPGRLARDARHEPARASATSSIRPASISAGTRRASSRSSIVEVHNTHGERHLYTLRRPAGDGPDFVASMDKDFYVSPFIDDGRALHGPGPGRADAPADHRSTRTRTAISCSTRASISPAGRLTDRTLARMLLRHPFVTHRTIGAHPLACAAAVAARRPLPSSREATHDECPDHRAAGSPAPCRLDPGTAGVARRSGRGGPDPRSGCSTVVLPDGSGVAFGDRGVANSGPRSRSTTARRFVRMLVGGETGGGEAYMDGLWSSPDLARSPSAGGPQPGVHWPLSARLVAVPCAAAPDARPPAAAQHAAQEPAEHRGALRPRATTSIGCSWTRR